MCDPATGECASMPMPDGSACDDGDACTAGDACSGGECVPGELDPEACADPVQCYRATPSFGGSSPRRDLLLADVFEEARYRVKHAEGLCTAVKIKVESSEKSGLPAGVLSPRDPMAMHSCHHMRLVETEPPQPSFEKLLVRVENRFGGRFLEVEKPRSLCVPAGDKKVPSSGVPYTCYHASPAHEPDAGSEKSSMESAAHFSKHEKSGGPVKLTDRYRTWSTSVLEPDMVCAQTRLPDGGEVRAEIVLTCFEVRYKVNLPSHFFWPRQQRTASTLGSGKVYLWRPQRVCIPSVMTDVMSAPEDDED
jgi:hypothetical protein